VIGAHKSVLIGLAIFFGLVASGQAQRKDAPFCAIRETETTKTLADGTHITEKFKTKLCRDSLGRTRTENLRKEEGNVSEQPPSSILIVDPIERTSYRLDPNGHTASRAMLTSPSDIRTGPLPAGPPRPAPGQQPQTSTESLGTQALEGILVEGFRVTTTFPAEMFGNDRPIVTVTESWSSRELGETLLSKRLDPRSGDWTTRLTDINRSEPDPALFRVPADYTIEDTPRPAGR
jgi:hypothetical protein